MSTAATDDALGDAALPGEAVLTDELAFVAGNPDVQLTRGTIHLFKLRAPPGVAPTDDQPPPLPVRLSRAFVCRA